MAYIIAMMIYISYLAFKNKQIGVIATTVTVIGFVAQTIAIIARWMEFASLSGLGFLKSAPFTNLYESLVFFVWCLILGYLIVEFKFRNRSFGAFITPIAGLALAFIDLSGVSKEIQPLVPALKSNWLLAHVTMSFICIRRIRPLVQYRSHVPHHNNRETERAGVYLLDCYVRTLRRPFRVDGD